MDSRPVPPVFVPSLTGTSVRRGVWSAEEHDRFLQALKQFPEGPWQQLALCVGTRSTRQVQTHAQKFFEKIRRRQRGLRRSYVHTGMAREHRVDDDVVAILSSIPTSNQSEDDNDDDDEEDDGGGDDEGDNEDGDHQSDNSKRGGANVRADSGADEKRTVGEATLSSSKDVRTPRSAGKRKRPSAGQESITTDDHAPKTLPRRVRIKRSARNALQIATNRDQLFFQATGGASAQEDASIDYGRALTPLSVESIDPVEPASQDGLPSIEEALDFFLNSIDTDSSSTNQRFPRI